MNRADLIQKLMETGHVDRTQAQTAVEAVLESMTEALRKNDKIELRGFGSFRVRQRRSRTGRNPKTGESVHVPAQRVPYFKPGRSLRELLKD